MVGTALTVGPAALATSVVGCKDESQPEYWLGKLDDSSWRPRAIKRLEQFLDDALTKANSDYSAPEVQALTNKLVEPLTNTYVDHYDEFDTKTRVTLIRLLSQTRDKRCERALKKAFEEFAKRPKSTKDEQDIKWAARAAGSLKLESLGPSMVEAFDKLRASSMLGGVSYRDVNEAMLAMPQKSWAGTLKTKLGAPIVQPKNAKDKDLIDPYRDQLFWQTTAAEVLGYTGDPSAVEPLMKVMLDPAKADVQATALLALVKLGKPAADAAVKLLRGEDQALAAFHARRLKEVTNEKVDEKEKPHVQTAALIIGTIGRPEGLAPMIDALKRETNDVTKAVIARELSKLPPTNESKQAFKDAFESISIDALIPPGQNALETLTEAAGQFYDSGMVSWLLERAEKTKATGEAKKSLQGAITVAVLKLAKSDQLAAAKKAVDQYGTDLEKKLDRMTEGLVKSCGDRVPCYLTAIEKSENQEQANQFTGIKAAYMIGILGNEQNRDELIERMDSLENAAVRFSATLAIDHLSPKGSASAAQKLKAIINKNLKSADQNKIQSDAPLKQVMYRLDARGG
jgi:HEAT repeat protein